MRYALAALFVVAALALLAYAVLRWRRDALTVPRGVLCGVGAAGALVAAGGLVLT